MWGILRFLLLTVLFLVDLVGRLFGWIVLLLGYRLLSDGLLQSLASDGSTGQMRALAGLVFLVCSAVFLLVGGFSQEDRERTGRLRAFIRSL